jgi:hypothetical protein
MKDYSQYGESSMLLEIFNKIGIINNYAVEFGASDGYWLSNIRMFIDQGWNYLQMDTDPKEGIGIKKEFITAENINEILDKHKVPVTFDLLSIDIDGNDYWVWKEIKRKPSIVIIEYNSNFSIDESVALEYNPSHSWDRTFAYSASISALKKLGQDKGYFLHKEVSFTNLIFIDNKFKDLLEELDIYTLKLPFHHHDQILVGKKFIKV